MPRSGKKSLAKKKQWAEQQAAGVGGSRLQLLPLAAHALQRWTAVLNDSDEVM